MNDAEFSSQRDARIAALQSDEDMMQVSIDWVRRVSDHRWAYNFTWLGRPAIQFPTDAWALQEIIWDKRPDIIVETGVARGGSVLFYASMLAILDLCDSLEEDSLTLPAKPRLVIGVEVDLRPENGELLRSHQLSRHVQIVVGSSTDADTFNLVRELIGQGARVMVVLDSNHSHEHVLRELQMYSELVTHDQYLVVFDTIIELMPVGMFPDRPWDKDDNPMSAVREFLLENSDFIQDEAIPSKLQITTAPGGFLRKVADSAT